MRTMGSFWYSDNIRERFLLVWYMDVVRGHMTKYDVPNEHEKDLDMGYSSCGALLNDLHQGLNTGKLSWF